MVPQVAAFTEDGHTAGELAAEVLLRALAIFAENLDYIVPIRRNTFEIFYWTRIHGGGILLFNGWLLDAIFRIFHGNQP